MAQARIAPMRFDIASALTARMAERARQLTQNLFDPYRPELHYMRGPGPKWREKYGQQLPAPLSERALPTGT